MIEKLTGTLQENVLTLLAHSDEHGKVIANIVDPALFEGDYRLLAERCVDYWRRHAQAPKYHTPDLVADILEDPHNRRASTFRRILGSMLDLSENINTQYVMQQLHRFTRMQRFKDAIIKSAEQLNTQQETAIEEVEAMWNSLLRVRETHFNAGTRLTDYQKFVDYLETQHAEFVTGIPQLDQRRIVPARGTVLLFLASAKRGKSWWLVFLGKHALLQRKRVVHISLEMDEDQVLGRYYQAMFAVSQSEERVQRLTLDVDDDGKLIGFEEEQIKPDFTLADKNVRHELEAYVNLMGVRSENLVIKRFPPRSIAVNDLRAYLDNLEVTEGFIPDLLILDYAGVLKTDARNHRISLGREFEEFRGLCVERNVAGVTAHQVSKKGAEAMQVSGTHVAEDWSMIATADTILTYSSTDAEKRLGLGRIRVTQARAALDGFGVLITQSYATGQFALDSTLLDNKYFDLMREQYDMGDEHEGADEDD